MVNRPFKCPLCSSVFKTESGMKWHIVYRHEIPTAFNIINKDYEAKTANLQEEIMLITQDKGELEKQLMGTTEKLVNEIVARVEAEAKLLQLSKDNYKAIMALAIRDTIIEKKLGITLKNPFEPDMKS